MADDVTPISGEYFTLGLGGIEGDLKFKTCSLPSGTLQPAKVDYINGQNKSDCATLPVRMNWSDIFISRAVDDTQGFWDWFKQGIPAEGGGTGSMEKKPLKLELKDGEGNTVRTWDLDGAYPTSYQGGGTLNAGSGAILVEQMSLHFDHCKIS